MNQYTDGSLKIKKIIILSLFLISSFSFAKHWRPLACAEAEASVLAMDIDGIICVDLLSADILVGVAGDHAFDKNKRTNSKSIGASADILAGFYSNESSYLSGFSQSIDGGVWQSDTFMNIHLEIGIKGIGMRRAKEEIFLFGGGVGYQFGILESDQMKFHSVKGCLRDAGEFIQSMWSGYFSSKKVINDFQDRKEISSLKMATSAEELIGLHEESCE